MKKFIIAFFVLSSFSAHAQLPCMDCDMVVPTSYNAVAASYSPGEDISSPTVAVCPWGIQLAAYSTFQMGPENTFCVYQEGKYLYFLAWELFPTIEQAKKRITKLELKGKAIPKPVKGFSIFIKPVQ